MLEENHIEHNKSPNLNSLMFKDIIRNIESNVIWRVVFCTVEAQPNIKSPEIILKSISPQINASLEDIVEAIQGLLSIGLLKMTEQGYVVSEAKFIVPSDLTTHSERILNFQDLISQVTATMLPNGFFEVRQRAFKCNKELVNSLTKEISQLLEKYDKLSDESNNSGVWECFFGASQVARFDFERKD